MVFYKIERWGNFEVISLGHRVTKYHQDGCIFFSVFEEIIPNVPTFLLSTYIIVGLLIQVDFGR